GGGVNDSGIRLQTLLENKLAGGGFLAIDRAAVIGSPINMAVVIDGRRNIGAFAGPPDYVRFGHIATAARADRQRRVAAAYGVNDSILSDYARANIAMDAFGSPKLLAGVRIHANQPVFNADDQLCVAVL